MPKVSIEQLERGDIVFACNPKSNPGSAPDLMHVMIYAPSEHGNVIGSMFFGLIREWLQTRIIKGQPIIAFRFKDATYANMIADQAEYWYDQAHAYSAELNVAYPYPFSSFFDALSEKYKSDQRTNSSSYGCGSVTMY